MPQGCVCELCRKGVPVAYPTRVAERRNVCGRAGHLSFLQPTSLVIAPLQYEMPQRCPHRSGMPQLSVHAHTG
eukprot:358894-Chlamydomonas_euryale.AAC.3